LRYRDTPPWPVEADGDGYSLVLVAPATAPDHELPENWRASVGFGGSPGASDTIPFTGNAATDLLTYALGDPGSVGFQFVTGVPVFEFLRTLGTDEATVKVELSSDLESLARRAGDPAEPIPPARQPIPHAVDHSHPRGPAHFRPNRGHDG
jgi:hypothetical protein